MQCSSNFVVLPKQEIIESSQKLCGYGEKIKTPFMLMHKGSLQFGVTRTMSCVYGMV
jgi:hypothetical protein